MIQVGANIFTWNGEVASFSSFLNATNTEVVFLIEDGVAIGSYKPDESIQGISSLEPGKTYYLIAKTAFSLPDIIPPVPPVPTLAELGGEPIGAELRSRSYTDLKISEIPPPPEIPTLAELGGEPVGAELRAKNYTDQEIDALPPPPTLLELGGESAGAEIRSKSYADSLVAALNTRILKLEGDYPNSFVYHWGYGGNAYNGTNQKSFSSSPQTSTEFYRLSSVEPPELGDTVELEFPLKAGNYKLEMLYSTGTSRGIASVYFNDVLVSTIDGYSSSTISQVRFSVNLSANTSGRQKIKIVVTGKNSSSSGYRFYGIALFVNPTPVLPPVNLVLINCGDQSNYTATDGRVWSADQHFSGGVRADIEAALGTTITIANTQNPRLYKFERGIDNGTFSYNIPVGQPGTFTVKLLFCENYHSSAGQRVGTVAINGANYLSSFDIFAEVGKHTALVKAWNGVVMPSSTVVLSITNTLINGIELIRTA